MIIFIVIAVFSLLVGIVAIILNRKQFKTTKFNNTIIYKDQQASGWNLGIARIRGIRSRIGFRYSLTEFYKKINVRDKQALFHGLLVFGFSSFVFFTFLAIGCGLIAAGEDWGWIIIGIVAFTIISVTIAHVTAFKNSRVSRR